MQYSLETEDYEIFDIDSYNKIQLEYKEALTPYIGKYFWINCKQSGYLSEMNISSGFLTNKKGKLLHSIPLAMLYGTLNLQSSTN